MAQWEDAPKQSSEGWEDAPAFKEPTMLDQAGGAARGIADFVGAAPGVVAGSVLGIGDVLTGGDPERALGAMQHLGESMNPFNLIPGGERQRQTAGYKYSPGTIAGDAIGTALHGYGKIGELASETTGIGDPKKIAATTELAMAGGLLAARGGRAKPGTPEAYREVTKRNAPADNIEPHKKGTEIVGKWEDAPVRRMDESIAGQMELPMQDANIRSPYNLTPEQIAQAEKDINTVHGQGDLFNDNRAYPPEEMAGRRYPLDEPSVGARDRVLSPEAERLQMDTPTRVGEMESRQGPPDVMIGGQADQRALPFTQPITDLGTVGAERAQRLKEMEGEKPIPYTPVRGPGNSQMGAVGDLEKLLRPGETLAFHGTSKDVAFGNFKSAQRGSFFTKDAEAASQYAKENDSMGYRWEGGKTVPKNTASRVMPVALDLKKIYTLSEAEVTAYSKAKSYSKFQRDMANKARSGGFDAVSYPDGGIQVVNPSKIRSIFNDKGGMKGPGRRQGGVIDPDLLTLGVSKLLSEKGPRETLKKFIGTFETSAIHNAIRNTLDPKSRETLVWMKPNDFHRLASDRQEYYRDTISPSKRRGIEGALKTEQGLDDIPFLQIDSEGKVYGHEGRHRMDVFMAQGMDLVPVRLRAELFRWGERGREERPKILTAQKGAWNEVDSIPMPTLIADQLKQQDILSKHRPMASQTGAMNFFGERTKDSLNKKGVVQTISDLKKMFTFDKRPLKQMVQEEQITPETMRDLGEPGSKLATRLDRMLQSVMTNALIDRQLAILSQNKGPAGKMIKWVVDNQTAINQRAKLKIEQAIEAGLKPWKALRQSNPKLLREALTTWQDRIGKSKLTEADFNTPRQWEVYRALSEQMKSGWERVNEARQKAGLNKIDFVENYFPAIREGDFWIHVLDGKGELKWSSAYNTIREAQEAHKILSKEFGADFQVKEPALKKKGPYDLSTFSAFEETIRAMSKDDPVKNAIQARYNEIVGKRGFGKTGIMRKNIGGALGFEEGAKGIKNAEHVLEAYFKRQESYIANLERAQLQKQVGEVGPKIWEKAPLAKRFIDDYLNKARGAELDALPMIRNLTEAISTEILGLGRQAPRKFIQNTSAIMSLMWLVTPRFLLSQFAQPLNAAAKLVDMYQLGHTVNNPVHSFFDGLAEALSPDAIARDGRKWAQKNGYLESTIVSLLELKLHDLKGEKWRLVDDAARWGLGTMEARVVRMPVFHMFEKTLRKEIPNAEERYQVAANLMDNYMVHYDRESSPMMYEKAGLLGEGARPLKTYAHNYWGQFFEYAQTAKDQGRILPLATMLGTQTLVSGMKGVILVAEATAIITAINAVFNTDILTPEQLLLESGASDTLIYGGYSSLIGHDISTSMASPSMPDMFSFPPAQFGVKAVQEGWNYIIKSLTGKVTDQDEMKALFALTPNAMRGWIEALYSEPGMPIPKPNEKMKGDFPAPTEPLEQFFRFGLSLKSLDESRANAIARAAKQLLARDIEHKMDSIDAITDRIVNGQPLPPELLKQYTQEGGDINQLSDNIHKRMLERSMTFSQREQTKPATPTQIHRLETLKKFLNDETEKNWQDSADPSKTTGFKKMGSGGDFSTGPANPTDPGDMAVFRELSAQAKRRFPNDLEKQKEWLLKDRERNAQKAQWIRDFRKGISNRAEQNNYTEM